jgi:molybdate transport system substrate-binding protein
VSTELFQRLGIAAEVTGKSKRIESERVGAVVARGEAELGFQQISELLPVPGIDYVGPLPPDVQRVTVFSAGIATAARNLDSARALIAFLRSPSVASVVRKTGLEPIAPKPRTSGSARRGRERRHPADIRSTSFNVSSARATRRARL